MEFPLLWAVVLIYKCGMKKEHYVWSVKRFLLFCPLLLLSTVYQFDGCLSFSGAWGLIAGLSGLASHCCILHLKDVLGTQPTHNDAVVYCGYQCRNNY